MLKYDGDSTIVVELPDGLTQAQILEKAKKELDELEAKLHGLELRFTGRITTTLSMYLGHRLAHIAKNISLYVPSEKGYILVISH
jgi:hypothetical protein